MKDVKRAQDLIGSDVYDRDGGRIGRVGNVYLDDATQQPEWVTVRTGLFGAKESFVPLEGAATSGENTLNVGVSKEKVKEAPRIEAEHGHLSDEEGRNLYDYYGLQRGSASPQQRDVPQQQQSESATREQGQQGQSASGMQAASGQQNTSGESTSAAGMSSGQSGSGQRNTSAQQETGSQQTTQANSGAGTQSESTQQQTWTTTSGPTTSSGTTEQRTETAQRTGGTTAESTAGAHTMTRSEERLRVTTEYVESGRVRLRKYITTEQETVTVPISREEVRIERVPIPESERKTTSSGASASDEIGASEQEIILHEERPVVNKESVPVERITMNTEQVTEEQTVQGDVRRERFDIDDETGRHHKQQEQQ